MLRRFSSSSWAIGSLGLVPLLAASVFFGCSSSTDGSGNGGSGMCGNLTVDPGEQCDGANVPSCEAATSGAFPLGTVQCSNCRLDMSGCSAGATDSGGTAGIGAGGSFGMGAGSGSGGTSGSGGDVGAGGTGSGGTNTGAGGTGADTGGTGGTGGTSNAGGPVPTNLPTATNCPTFPTSPSGGTIQVARSDQNVPVVIYMDPAAKSKPAPGGPLVLYYHASYEPAMAAEVHQGFGDANIKAVTDAGGVVASFTHVACSTCTTTDDAWWFVEDDPVQDQVVACAIQQANIDTRHIHALGWSAGALHTMHIAFARANYMASVISYSGGGAFGAASQDPSNKVASIQTYGDQGSDQVVIDFNTNSHTYYTTYQPQGYYTMMCHHPGGHEIDPGIAPVSLQFFLAHPYKVSPEPYANAIPAGFPAYCGNTPQ